MVRIVPCECGQTDIARGPCQLIESVSTRPTPVHQDRKVRRAVPVILVIEPFPASFSTLQAGVIMANHVRSCIRSWYRPLHRW